MRIALDSNILVYLAGGERRPGDAVKVAAARATVGHLLATGRIIAPVQAIGEATRVLREKYRRSPAQVATAFEAWTDIYEPVPTDADSMAHGITLADDHRFQHWDAIIVAISADADCAILLSEDMQHGFVWRGLTVVNPFADPPHPLLASLL